MQLKTNEIQYKYFYIFIGFVIVMGVIDIIKTKREDKDSDKKHNEIISEIKSINPEKVPPDKSFPGYGIVFVLKFGDIQEERRKFIVDIGQESDRNRVSIYLDRANNLVYRIFDDEGEPHVIKIPHHIHTFQFDTYYHFYFDYGVAGNYSFMRVFINNTELGKIIFKEKLKLPQSIDLDKDKLTIGADIFGGNNSKFQIQMLATLKNTFNSDERNGLMTIFETYLESIKKEN